MCILNTYYITIIYTNIHVINGYSCLILRKMYTTCHREHTRTHENTREHTRTHANTREHTRTHENTREHTRTHANTREHTMVHAIHAHWDVIRYEVM